MKYIPKIEEVTNHPKYFILATLIEASVGVAMRASTPQVTASLLIKVGAVMAMAASSLEEDDIPHSEVDAFADSLIEQVNKFVAEKEAKKLAAVNAKSSHLVTNSPNSPSIQEFMSGQ